jgi:ribonucleoside-diphosphate reductase beta chain
MILHQYIEWLTDSRMSELGLPIQFGTKNPIKGWIDPWMDNSIVQVAPQETEISSYVIGGTKQDVNENTFAGLSL